MPRTFNKLAAATATVIALATATASFASSALTLDPQIPETTPAQTAASQDTHSQPADATETPLTLSSRANNASWNKPADAWRFQANLGVWFSGVQGDVSARDRKVDFDASFGDLLGDLQWGLAVDFEAGKGPLSVIVYGLYMVLDSDATGPAGIVDAGVDTDFGIFDVALAYNILNVPFKNSSWPQNFGLDILGGGRVTYVSVDVTLSDGTTELKGSDSATWLDPYAGARARLDFTQKFNMSVSGTAGGSPVGSNFTWSLLALAEYRFTEHLGIFGGYKIIAYNYDQGDLKWDASLMGPIAGLSIRW